MKEEIKKYEAPVIEIIEVQVESGFATSANATIQSLDEENLY